LLWLHLTNEKYAKMLCEGKGAADAIGRIMLMENVFAATRRVREDELEEEEEVRVLDGSRIGGMAAGGPHAVRGR
jgi:hypothetical protein